MDISNSSSRTRPDVKILAANWLFGVRHVLNRSTRSAPRRTCKGLKIRIPPLQMWVETFKALECKRPDDQLRRSLHGADERRGRCGRNRRSKSIYAAKFYEVKKTLSMTGHFTNWIAPMMSAKVFNSLPKETQDILLRGGRDRRRDHHRAYPGSRAGLPREARSGGRYFRIRCRPRCAARRRRRSSMRSSRNGHRAFMTRYTAAMNQIAVTIAG